MSSDASNSILHRWVCLDVFRCVRFYTAVSFCKVDNVPTFIPTHTDHLHLSANLDEFISLFSCWMLPDGKIKCLFVLFSIEALCITWQLNPVMYSLRFEVPFFSLNAEVIYRSAVWLRFAVNCSVKPLLLKEQLWIRCVHSISWITTNMLDKFNI